MAKLTLSLLGYILLIFYFVTAENTQNGRHKFQRIILRKPAPRDEFGDQVMKDDLYECKVWNAAIAELPALKTGDKVKAVLGIQGVEHTDVAKGHVMYYTQISIKKIEKI